MDKLVDGLRYFQAHVAWDRRELFERSVRGQKPHAMLITCSDSRVLPETLMQADPGDLFVSRNAGNLVPPPDAPSGEAATIEYAVTALGVTDIIVCGHYRCGAVRAILHPEEGGELTKTRQWLAHAAESKAVIEREHPELHGEALWDKAVERNVLAQVNNLAKHPAVAAALAAGTVRLHAWVLRFETSDVLAYDPMTGEFSPLVEMPVIRAVLPAPESPFPSSAEVEPTDVPSPAARPKWFEALRGDVPASIAVFAVALPMCVAIAKACGAPTAAGIITAVVGGIVVSVLGGGPFQVSGPTAGLIVVLLGVGDRLGFAGIGVVVFLAGLLQIVAGFFRLAQWFRAVSPAVILGMLAGIGVVLLAQQFHVTVDDLPARSPLANLVAIPNAVVDVFDGHPGHPEHRPAALTGLLALAVLLFWKPLTERWLRAVPAVLVAVVATTVVAGAFRLPIQRVEFDGLTAGVSVLSFVALPELLLDGTVWQLAVTVAVVASAESLLTAAAVDQMHTGPRTRYDRELAAQGVGNVLCGVLGALPMAGVIVRSAANVRAGAKSRGSAVLHGVWMLGFVVLMPGLLRLIPTAALAATLVLTGIKLIEVNAIRALWKENRVEGMICLSTAAGVVTAGLLSGVLFGVGLSVVKLIYTFSRLRIRRRDDAARGRTTIVLEGSATFIRLPRLAAALEAVPSGTVLHVDSKGLSYIDHACLRLFINWEKQHDATGGRLVFDWDTMRARFRTERPRPRTVVHNRPFVPEPIGPCQHADQDQCA